MIEFRLDQSNSIRINKQIGRIIELKLRGYAIITSQQPYEDTGYGCFLMFPWISKSPNNPYNTNMNSYHGLCINSKRQLTILSESQDQIKFSMIQPQTESQLRHSFIQTLTLKKDQLHINIRVIKNQNDIYPCCFGYHPYFQLNKKKIEDLQIKTDIKTLLQFDQNTLPIYPFKQRQIEIHSKDKLNNLFKGGTFLSLYDNQQGVLLKIQSDLPYWQIYTPQNRTTISVQPISFCGNLYGIHKVDPAIILVDQGNISIKVSKDQ